MRLAIIGSGPGGYVAAIKAAQLGAHVTIIEDTEVGGTCLNRGCIPTKSLIASSGMYAKLAELDKFGIELDGSVRPNLAKMMERMNKIVDTQVKGIRSLFKSWGVNLIEGRGKLIAENRVEARLKDDSTSTIEADKIIVATGSRPARIAALGMDGASVISSDEALKLTEIPKSIIIVGAGVIGCEWACILRDLGAEVTIVEMLERAVSTEDHEISDLLARELKKKKIKLVTGIGVQSVEKGADGVTATLSDGRQLKADKILVSIGRSLNTEDIGLEALGIEKGSKGEISVSTKMQTSVPGVYAIGDVTGGILLAHTASSEGVVAAMNICGQDTHMDYNAVPAAIFTSPEIASVGLREHQASEKGIKARTGHFQFRALGKAHAIGEIAGMVKVVADHDSDRVLGVHIIGPHASDLIHEAALAVNKGLTLSHIAGTIHAHPTLAEALMEAAEDAHGSAIHAPKKQA